ncbi:hypothetical protein MTR67_033740 [Solanum verrucosum]|uniref:TF-B3 domain-containing protein n=1 Tax=Solanum verrucosum TaxID=315347 RepID=A0AAF0ZJL4_SOLVR|nr:B3 domain-containing protein REM9-like [Solanum verrucosum]WMV40355.1 hypothetical protein MTR67_033740 [Solanum verrucosum]
MKISPKNPHFFKPILPGFKQGIKIPKGFLKYVKKYDQYEHAILRRADKKWRVKVNGRRLEDGWEKFAEQHDLHLRDILVFRHEGDMEFEISIFDLNQQCEREYKYEYESKDKPNHNIKSSRKASHFVCIVRPYCLSRDALLVPKEFASRNGLFNTKKRDLLVRDERQRSWNVILRSYGDKTAYLVDGWNKIRDANCLKEGDCIMFEVVTSGNKPIWKFKRMTEQ